MFFFRMGEVKVPREKIYNLWENMQTPYEKALVQPGIKTRPLCSPLSHWAAVTLRPTNSVFFKIFPQHAICLLGISHIGGHPHKSPPE